MPEPAGTEYQLEVRRSAIDRKGCFAAEAIPANAAIREYTGEVITAAEALRREADLARPGIYTMWIDDDWAIDGWYGGNESLYMNHSCAPNCYMDNVGQKVFIYAERDIAAGEELTIDYSYEPAPVPDLCACGAPECRGTINAPG